jgi:streptogramin lyase
MRKQSGMILLQMSLLFLAGCAGNMSAPSAHRSPTPAAPTITEFPLLPNSRGPTGITAGPDGNLWFTENGGGIGRITPAGQITEFPIPGSGTNNSPSDITAGPDGNLWFTQRRVNQIGRMTPAGTVTEFPLPTPNNAPDKITAGPDGNLWFTEPGSGMIGRITTGK